MGLVNDRNGKAVSGDKECTSVRKDIRADSEAVDWYRLYRPRKLKEVVGQPEAVATLQNLLKNGMQKVLIFTGPSGTGKTTLARIVASRLGCGDDFQEVNCAAIDGAIDTIRSIERSTKRAPSGENSCRVWFWEECFSAGTLVSTLYGDVPIQDIRIGDVVRNISGVGIVEGVFANRVPVSRVVRLDMSDGTVVFCSAEHRFLTEDGWYPASELHSDVAIIGIPSYAKGLKGECHEVSVVPERLYSEVPLQQAEDLFQVLCPASEESLAGQREIRRTCVPVLREGFCMPCGIEEETLQQAVCREGNHEGSGTSIVVDASGKSSESGIWVQEVFEIPGRGCVEGSASCNAVRSRSEEEKIEGVGRISADGRVCCLANAIVQANDGKQSNCRSESDRKGVEDEGTHRESTSLEGETRREWSVDYSAEEGSEAPSSVGRRGLDSGTGYFNRDGKWESPWSSHQLQSRHREQESEDSRGNRWERASVEKGYLERLKEDTSSRRVRLVRSQVYQRGSNEQAFLGIVSDKESSEGFVTFYDLQVSGNPSYFVYGLPVHNCQSLSRAGFAQQAMLKMFEDVPPHVYHFLATTDPQKVLPAIRTRCTEICLRALKVTELEEVLRNVADKAGKPVSDAVINRIIECAGGSAREAVKNLQKVAGLPEEQQLAILEPPAAERAAFDLVKMLVWQKPSWEKVRAFLAECTEDPEMLRRLILANARKELLKPKGNHLKAAAIIDWCKEPWFDSGEARLAYACYEILKAN